MTIQWKERGDGMVEVEGANAAEKAVVEVVVRRKGGGG